jgi:hypothetical protein
MLLKAVFDTETINERINERLRSGASAGTRVHGQGLHRWRELIQPEAFYLFPEDGQRAFIAVFDLADLSQIPAITEPLWFGAKAKITLTPCMTVEDAEKGEEEAARWIAIAATQGQPAQ